MSEQALPSAIVELEYHEGATARLYSAFANHLKPSTISKLLDPVTGIGGIGMSSIEDPYTHVIELLQEHHQKVLAQLGEKE
jgi:hypothetical protein